MANFGPIAGTGIDTTNAKGSQQLYAGESDIVTTQGKLDPAGAPYVGGQVLARATATGIFGKHNPGGAGGLENAIAILGYDVPVVVEGKYEAIYTGGVFNIEALTFHEDTDNRDKMAAVFDGTNIVAQQLWGSPKDNSGPI